MGYERYFTENADKSEEELVAQCGDVDLIISEQLGGMPTTWLPIRILLLLALSILSHYQLFVRATFPLSISTLFDITVFTMMMVLLISGFVVIMGRAMIDITKKPTRRIIVGYIVNFAIVLIIGILINYIFFSTVHDQKIFSIIDAMTTEITPSNIGYIFATCLEILNLAVTLTAAGWALMSIRIGFFALPMVCLNLSLCTFFTACARFLSQLSSPEDIERQLSSHVGLIALELVIRLSICTLLCFVMYTIIRRRNARTA